MFMSTLPSMPETEPVLEYCQMLKYWLNVGAFTLYCASQMLMCQVRKVIAKQVLHAAIDHGRVARFLDARTEGRGILRHLFG